MRSLFLLLLVGGCGLTLELAPPPGDNDGDASVADAPMDVPPDAPGCDDVAACDGLPRTAPASICAPYRCEGGFCLENDLDGDGFGPGCESPDCDDLDPSVTLDGVVLCSPRPGICASAVAICTDGVPGACMDTESSSDEVCNGLDDDCDDDIDEDLTIDVGIGCARPYECVDGDWVAPPDLAGVEICGNGLDDDCDEFIDETCPPERCVYVSHSLAASGEPLSPRGGVETIREALPWLDDELNTICLMAVPSADSSCTQKTHVIQDDLPPGVTVVGNLRRHPALDEAIPCDGRDMTLVVAVEGVNATVRVDPGAPSTLRNLSVLFPSADGTLDAIRVEAGASLSVENVSIYGAGGAGAGGSDSVGIRVGAGGSVQVTQTNIENPGTSSWGIDAVDATVVLHDACVGGMCDCSGPAIHGNQDGSAVRMDGGNLAVDNYALCSSGFAALETNDTNVLVAGSTITTDAVSDAEVVAIDCSAANTVLLHGNLVRVGSAAGDVTGVRLRGACNPVLSANRIYALDSEDDVLSAVGVHCGRDTRCVLGGNEIFGVRAAAFAAEFAAGVVCEDDGCALLAGNMIVASEADGTRDATGVEILNSTSPIILERNRIAGGCAIDAAVGVDGVNAVLLARSNLLLGTECESAAEFVSALEFAGGNATLDGNTIHSGGGSDVTGAGCVAVGASVQNVRLASRNNLFGAGLGCASRTAFESRGSDPVVLSHNGFTHANEYTIISGTVYRDAASLNGLPGFRNNVMDEMPLFVAYPVLYDLTVGSPFLGKGSLGAPPDFYGNARPNPPSMGAFEIASSP